MRRIKPILFSLAISCAVELEATMPVIDYSAIYNQLVTSRRDLTQQLMQVKNQREQILQVTSQIRQLDSYLDRFGDPGEIELQALKDLYELVRELPATKSSKELERILSEDILFIKQDVYKVISKDITVDGEVVSARDTSAFKPDLAARQEFIEYHDLKDRALKKRSEIDEDLQASLRKLESASTASEVQKLQVVIASLNAQRAEVTKEIDLAASSATTRYFQNEVEERIAREARDQKQRETLKVGMRKSLSIFRFPDGPTIFKP